MSFGQSANQGAEARVGSERAESGMNRGPNLVFSEQGQTYTNQEIFRNMAASATQRYDSNLPDLSYLLASAGPEVNAPGEPNATKVLQGHVETSLPGKSPVLKLETPEMDHRTYHNEHTNSDLPTTRWGAVTKAEADKQWNTFESLPKADREALRKEHYHLNVGNSLADYKPELVGQDARGQHRKQEQIHAFQDPHDHSINITLRPVDQEAGNVVVLSNNLKVADQEDGVKHETGHALNDAFHDFANSKAFMDAYKKDKDAIWAKLHPGEKSPKILNYYLDPVVDSKGLTPEQISNRKSEIGRSELFAEMYSAIRTLPENRTAGQKAIVENFHNVLMVENHQLQEFNRQETVKSSDSGI